MHEQRELLKRWVSRDHQTVRRQTLLAGADRVEQADALCDWLLKQGWITRHDTFSGGGWHWEAITWRDLPALKRLLNVGSRSQRDEARAQLLAQAHVRLIEGLPTGDGALAEALHQALAGLTDEGAIKVETLQSRLQLLHALRRWCEAQQQGTRRDFALQATGQTKGITASDWRWLERHFDLEGLGVSAFQLMMTLAGSVRLQASAGAVDLRAASFMALPLPDVRALTSAQVPSFWWLIENRASFERQCQPQGMGREQGACIVWMPGRVAPAWREAMAHLLALAPAPLRISADIDPAGIDMALDMGRLWQARGLTWQPHGMDEVQLQAIPRPWLLTEYDQAMLDRLLAEGDTMPPALHRLCLAMRSSGTKAEQEGWL